jgi:hypothetical protein
MKIKNYISGLILFSALLLVSCDREPMLPPEPVIEHITIAQLRDMYKSGIMAVDTNVYIQGIITLTPELGNIPSFVAYIQDTTAAVCLTLSDAVNTLAMDSEVKVLCRGVMFEEYNGLLQFGSSSSLSIASNIEVIKLTASPPVPDTLTIAQLLTGEFQGQYVCVPGAQFKSTGTFSGSKTLSDCDSEIAVYTSSSATFAATTLPTGNGFLTGISSIYNSQQILLRDPSEFDMTGDLCGVPSVTYLIQDFNSLAKYADVSVLAGWKTYSEQGSKTWYCNEVTGKGKWVQVYIYNSGQPSVITWMVAPQIDLSVASSPFITFESAAGYDNGATLQFFVSNDYTGSATPWTNTWIEKSFTRPPVVTSGYSNFVSSGIIDLSEFIGNTIFVAWVVKGADLAGTASDKTTTWEVDNVLIGEE